MKKLKGYLKTFAEEKWLKYDEPSLRWDGNLATAKKEVVIFTKDKVWDLIRAKTKFPEGDPELASTRFPSNDLIGYILKMKTVFTRTLRLGEYEVGLVIMSNDLRKGEILAKLEGVVRC